MSEVLLDTCAVLWLAGGQPMSDKSLQLVRERHIHISPITAWEIANLVRKSRITLSRKPAAWFREALAKMNAELSDLDIELLTDSCALPGQPPNDPADRIIIATARENDMTIVTRDRLILDYARDGHVRAMTC